MTESVPMTEFIVRCEHQEFLGEKHYHKREEIVRCRDCRYYTHSSWHRCDLRGIAHEVKPDGFCAWGEKVEG